MVKPYSRDLRERVIEGVEGGMSRREAARHYRVSEASAIRWVEAYRATGRRSARAMGGDRRSVLPAERAWLFEVIDAEPEVTLMALSARLAGERGVQADASMLSRFFKAEGISFKKKRSRNRAGAA